MQCFSTIEQTVTIAPNVPAGKWELKLLSLDQIVANAKAVKAETAHSGVRANGKSGVNLKLNEKHDDPDGEFERY